MAGILSEPSEPVAVLPAPSAEAVPTTNGSIPAPSVMVDGAVAKWAPLTVRSQNSVADTWGFFKAVRRRWFLALTLSALAAAVATAGAWYLLPVRHTATTTLYAPGQAPTLGFANTGSKTDYLMYQRTQKELVKSRVVLIAALSRPDVAALRTIREQNDPADWLETQLQVTFPVGAELLRISLSGERSDDLKAVVDAVADAYLQEIVYKERNKRRDSIKQLEEIRAKYQEAVEGKWKTVEQIATTVGYSTDPQTLMIGQRMATAAMALAQRELLQTNSDLRKKRAQLSELQAKERDTKPVSTPAAMLDRETDKDPRIGELLRKKMQAEQNLARDVHNLVQGEQSSIAQKYRAEIATLQGQIDDLRKEVRPNLAQYEQAKVDSERKSTLEHLTDEIAYLKTLEQRLDDDVRQLAKETKSIGKGTLNIESYRREITQSEEVLHKMGTHIDALNLEMMAPERVTILEKASVSSLEGQKRHLSMAGGAGLGAWILVVVGIGLLEYRKGRIDSVDDVVRGLGMPVVGTLPAHSARRFLGASRRLPQPDWKSQLTQSVDAVRTMLLHAARTERLRVILITSAVTGEGKTSLAGHLAASLARAGRNTLLVDCDLRRPAIHRLFEVSATPGVAEVLRGETMLEQAVRTGIGPIAILPAGCCDARALQALAQGGLQSLLAKLREQYDFIVVDSCPVLPVADSLLIAQAVDGVLLSLLRDVSQLPRLLAAYERLAMLGVRMLGAVVNGARECVYDPAYQ